MVSKKKCQFKKQRVFLKPQLNYDANSYYEMIDWQSEGLYEPPFTKALTDDELRNIEHSPLVINICSNSVLTERTIRTVDQVAQMSTSSEIREGMVRAINNDRKAKPALETKSDLLR